MKKVFLLGILIVVIGASFPASGADEQLQSNEITMEEVVVTATKTTEKRKDISNSVILKDQFDIQESPASSLGELISNEPGIDWRTRGNYGGAAEEIHIRGMDGSGTSVFIDGINFNSPSLGTADVGKIPLNSIDRIELVKGAGSVLYGSGAMGGTVNIITKSPERDKMDLRLSAGYGSNNMYNISAEQGMYIFDNFGYYITASKKETDGFRDNSDLNHKNATLKLLFDKGKLFTLTLYGDYLNRDYGVPGVKPPKGTQDYFVNGIRLYNEESANLLNKGSDEDKHLALEMKAAPLNRLDLSLKADYTNIENYDYSRWLSWTGTLVGAKSWTRNKIYRTEGNVNLRPVEGGSILLGAEHKKYDWENEGIDLDGTGSELPGTKSVVEETLRTLGTYAETQYRPCKYFKAIAGIRHEHHSEFGTENVPRFGMIINPIKNTVLKMSHGKHFRAPTPNDLFWPEGSYTKGNPNLGPETGWHTDFTFEQSLKRNLIFLTCSYFKWNVDNKILWSADSDGIWTPQNLETYKADGLEFGVKIGPFFNLTLNLDFTYLDAKEKSKEYYYQSWWPVPDLRYNLRKRRATYVPMKQFKSSLTYFTQSGLTATATARYTSDRSYYRDEAIIPSGTDYHTVEYVLDAYWTVDIKVSQKLFKNWTLTLQANNLFDKEYDTYFGTFADQATSNIVMAGYPGAGRSLFFGLSYEF